MRVPGDPGEAARALEATLLRQLISSSGVFKGGAMAGSEVHAGMFVEALAEAVTKGGGLGLAPLLERSLEGPAPAEAPSAEVTSGFGLREHPIDGVQRFHTGIDLRGAEGAPIRAVADGVVRRAGPRGGYGNAVEIDHGGGVTSLYAHASALEVRPGDVVRQGDAIGAVGATGRATGPHLHLEVRVDGKPVDPRAALRAYAERTDNPDRGSR